MELIIQYYENQTVVLDRIYSIRNKHVLLSRGSKPAPGSCKHIPRLLVRSFHLTMLDQAIDGALSAS